MGEAIQQYFEAFRQVEALEEQDQDAAVALARDIAGRARAAGDEGFALFFEGEASCLAGELTEGAQLLSRAAAMAPAADFIYANYGVVLSMLGQVREALTMLDQALQLNDRNLIAWGQKGVCLSKLLRDDQALHCFDQVLALEPENAHALRNKAVSLSRLRREKEALSFFDRALAINPYDRHALSEKRILLEEMRLRGTPLGWVVIWLRKVVKPALKRLFIRI